MNFPTVRDNHYIGNLKKYIIIKYTIINDYLNYKRHMIKLDTNKSFIVNISN